MDGEPQSPNYAFKSRVSNTVASNEIVENILPRVGAGNYAGSQEYHQLRQVLPAVELYRRKSVYVQITARAFHSFTYSVIKVNNMILNCLNLTKQNIVRKGFFP
jgi:hypothetical protein